MAEWLYEAGIGEARAALIEDGVIVEAAIELDADPLSGSLRVGTVATARLIDHATGRVRVGEQDALMANVPPGLTEGGALRVRVVREVVPEAGRAKLVKVVATDEPVGSGPDLLGRLVGAPVRRPAAHEADLLEEAGWSELLEEAVEGEIAFAGGALRMSPTPAMTLFDVDGSPPLDALAVRAAGAVGRAVRRHGIGGSIGVDFPTLAGKVPRQAVATALDAALPRPFERTVVNGFGFLQIVRPRLRASLPELLRADPVGTALRALLRRLEREPPGGPRVHRASRGMVARLDARPAWRAELTRRTGVAHTLECP